MEKLIEHLQKSCEDFELITELIQKYKNLDVVSEKLLYKKIEDGLLSNLLNAQLYQLKIMKDGYRFKYYDKNITDKLIDVAIKSVERKEKLKKIEKIED